MIPHRAKIGLAIVAVLVVIYVVAGSYRFMQTPGGKALRKAKGTAYAVVTWMAGNPVTEPVAQMVSIPVTKTTVREHKIVAAHVKEVNKSTARQVAALTGAAIALAITMGISVKRKRAKAKAQWEKETRPRAATQENLKELESEHPQLARRITAASSSGALVTEEGITDWVVAGVQPKVNSDVRTFTTKFENAAQHSDPNVARAQMNAAGEELRTGAENRALKAEAAERRVAGEEGASDAPGTESERPGLPSIPEEVW